MFFFFFLFLNNFLGFCSFPDIFFSSPISVYGPSSQKASVNKGVLTYGLPSSSLATKKGFVGCSNAAGSRLAPLGLMSIVDRLVRDYILYIHLSVLYIYLFTQQWRRGDKRGPAWIRASRNPPWERRRGQGGRCPTAGAGPSGGCQVPPPGVLAAAGLPALRNPPRSRGATSIYAAEGCLTQGAFSCGGQRPSEHSSGCTSGRALKNPEAGLCFSSSSGSPPRALQQDPAASSRRVGCTELGRAGGCWGGFWGEQPPPPNPERLRDTAGRGREARDTLATQVGPTRQDIQDIQPRYLGSRCPSFLLEPPARGEGTSVSGRGKSTQVRPESSRRLNRGPQSLGH